MNYTFDVENVTNRLIDWIRNWFDKNGKDCNAVIGISGGKDSTIAAALLEKALGSNRVIGVLMPNGEQSDIEDAYKVVDFLKIRSIEVNIENTVNAVYESIDTAIYDLVRQGFNPLKISTQTKINLPARIRMSTLYAISQSSNGRVVNTCNMSEDYIGYSTKYGDAAGDFSLFANLTVTEIIMIGDYLKLPYELVHKTPSDGLCGKSDEDNLGFTYETLDFYIRFGIKPSNDIKNKIDNLHQKNMFKLKPMEAFR